MTSVCLVYSGQEATGEGADADEALTIALKKIPTARGKNECFVVAANRGGYPDSGHTIEMTCRMDGSVEVETILVLDLGRHYRGAIETVRVIANLEHGFAGRTKHAIEEVSIYAIGAAKYLMRMSGKKIDTRGDLGRALNGTPWKKLIDVENLLLKRSG